MTGEIKKLVLKKRIVFKLVLCYNQTMKKVYTETGKYLYDISKIVLGLAVITPLIKDESMSISALGISFAVFIVGAYFIKKGD